MGIYYTTRCPLFAFLVVLIDVVSYPPTTNSEAALRTVSTTITTPFVMRVAICFISIGFVIHCFCCYSTID